MNKFSVHGGNAELLCRQLRVSEDLSAILPHDYIQKAAGE